MVFGDFASICEKSPLPICSLIRPLQTSSSSSSSSNISNYPFNGILPTCYARSINIANTLIFEVGTAFINIGNLIVLLMIIYNVRSRYTSVARKEMLFFFWISISQTIATLIIDTGVSPPGSSSYAYFVSFQIANLAVSCWSLLFAGFSSFNFWDDGSFKAMLSLIIGSIFVFIVNYLISIFTFKGWGSSLNHNHTTPLFVFYFVLNAIMLCIWLLSQIFICCFTLVFNWWALGALFLSTLFFAASQILLYAVSDKICNQLNHYVDGSLFSSISMMACYMMVYKYWDIITFDDDEYYRFTEFVPAVSNKEEAKMLLQK
mgnify:FL=1